MMPVSAPAAALNAAFTRFERASETLVRSVSGDDSADGAAAVAEMIEARHAAQAATSVVHFSDEMFKALIAIGQR